MGFRWRVLYFDYCLSTTDPSMVIENGIFLLFSSSSHTARGLFFTIFAYNLHGFEDKCWGGTLVGQNKKKLLRKKKLWFTPNLQLRLQIGIIIVYVHCMLSRGVFFQLFLCLERKSREVLEWSRLLFCSKFSITGKRPWSFFGKKNTYLQKACYADFWPISV